jgi:hypothetical protein
MDFVLLLVQLTARSISYREVKMISGLKQQLTLMMQVSLDSVGVLQQSHAYW